MAEAVEAEAPSAAIAASARSGARESMATNTREIAPVQQNMVLILPPELPRRRLQFLYIVPLLF